MKTRRQTLEECLRERGYGPRELSLRLGMTEKQVCEDLEHVAKSVAARGGKLVLSPAECAGCGYVFEDRRKLTKPGKCPKCRSPKVLEPCYHIE